jgi:uncharacterized membrane protein YbhN (UPF0104 family)
VSRRIARLAVRLAISFALLGAIVWAVDSAGLWRRLARADFSWFLLAVVLGILANVVSAWRWLTISRHLGLSATAGQLLPAYGRGVTLNTILPGATLGGDAYRAVVLQKLGNPMLKAAASVALDRLSGLWALFVISWFAWLALAFAGDTPLPPASVHLHVVGIACAVAAPFLARRLADRLALDPHAWPARLLRLLSETARLAQVTFVSSAVVQLATIAALWAALHAVTPDVPLLYLVAIAAPVFLATALPVSVGGYGTREAAIAAYYLLAGLPAEVAVAGGLLHGLAVTLQGALWAPLFLLEHHEPAHR